MDRAEFERGNEALHTRLFWPAAGVLSVLVHLLFLWLFLGLEPGPKMPAVCIVHLKPQKEIQRKGLTVDIRESALPEGKRYQFPVPGSLLKQGNQSPHVFETPKERGRTAEDRVLAQIHKQLQPLWHEADPPGPGRVDLDMEITVGGLLRTVRIARAQGDPALPDFVLDLVHRAEPFLQAGVQTDTRVIVGCTFVVHSKGP